jgi:hypothetical protein
LLTSAMDGRLPPNADGELLVLAQRDSTYGLRRTPSSASTADSTWLPRS